MWSATKKAGAPGRIFPGSRQRAHRRVLPNGLTLVVVPRPHLQTAAVGAFVKVGSRYENRETGGLSHLLEHMLFRGTSRHPSAHELNLAVEEIGGTAYGVTHPDFTVLGITLPPETLRSGIAILGDLLSAPMFADLEVEKKIILEEILQSLDEEGRNIDVDELSRQILYGQQPLGFSIAGSAANIRRFGLADLREHMRRFYSAKNLVLCVAGAVTVREAHEWVCDHLGGLPPGEPVPTPPPLEIPKGSCFRYVESPGSQTDVRVLLPTFGEADPRRMALHLLVRVIDDGMSTRLQRRICDAQGLAYEVFSVLEQLEDCGVFGVGATAEHAKIPLLVREVLEMFRELTVERIETMELEKATRRFQWSLRAILDSAEALCSHYGMLGLFDLESDLQRLADCAAGVTVDQLVAVARDVVRPDRLKVACVGMLNQRQRRQTRTMVEGFGL